MRYFQINANESTPKSAKAPIAVKYKYNIRFVGRRSTKRPGSPIRRANVTNRLKHAQKSTHRSVF